MQRTMLSRRKIAALLSIFMSSLLFLLLRKCRSDIVGAKFTFQKSNSLRTTYPRIAYRPREQHESGWLEIDYLKARKQATRFDTGRMMYNSDKELYKFILGAKSSKYFYESKKYNWHADSRFAIDDRIQNSKYKNAKLKEILTAWTDFTRKYKLVSWIAHGMLIGHYWNGQLLPYDEDLDFQMPFSEFSKLEQLNSTMHQNRFLLDVNPNAKERGLQKENVIDARFICTKTGLYIDITLLAQLEEGVFFCKSPHFYWGSDLFPLKSTMLDGVEVWRPNNVVDILYQEYGARALFKRNLQRYKFDGDRWVPKTSANR